MRSNRTLEIGTGLFVLLGFAALVFLTTQLPASGLKVGEVEGIRFDPQTYKAVVSLRIDPQYNQIPEDSFAAIQTQGLLGGKYIGLSPGGLDTYLKNGSRIDNTQSAIVLESLINKFLANFSSSSGSSSGQNSSQDSGQKSGNGDSSKEPKK